VREHGAGRLDPTLPAAVARRGGWLGPGDARRLLQPVSIHEHNHAIDRSPLQARRRGAPSLRWTGRRPPDGVEAIRHVDHRIRVMVARRRSRPCDPDTRLLKRLPKKRLLEARRAPPAEVSRVRGRSAFATRRLSSGGACVRDARSAGAAAFQRRPSTRASPQPDPLGHLLSHDRGAPEGESGAARRIVTAAGRNESGASGYGTPPTITPRDPWLPGKRESFGPTWSRDLLARGKRDKRGPRAASLEHPRRSSRSAAPEVPSIDAPPGAGYPAFAR